MRYEDMPKPVAKLTSGQLEESYPEAHTNFKDDFLCSIEFVDFYVDAKDDLWAFVDVDEVYLWQPSYKNADGTTELGHWMDWSDIKPD